MDLHTRMEGTPELHRGQPVGEDSIEPLHSPLLGHIIDVEVHGQALLLVESGSRLYGAWHRRRLHQHCVHLRPRSLPSCSASEPGEHLCANFLQAELPGALPDAPTFRDGAPELGHGGGCRSPFYSSGQCGRRQGPNAVDRQPCFQHVECLVAKRLQLVGKAKPDKAGSPSTAPGHLPILRGTLRAIVTATAARAVAARSGHHTGSIGESAPEVWKVHLPTMRP
mmetsp:Transcript_125621/g.280295  ORF Transcript_125621/g.280295 Transcript_125621/m.280295 type:complete len:224 (+) Transcript_125621:671-1342(+)